MKGEGRYRAVLRKPGVLPSLVSYALSRIATTMALLAILLLTQQQAHSFKTAGAIAAAFATATAVVAPALGRLVDRRGPWPVLLSCALVHPLALVFLVLFERHSQWAAAMAAAALAGASLPPVSSCMRAAWPLLVDDDELMGSAWSIEGLVVEATELGGPLVVGLAMLVGNAAAAVLIAAALSYLGPVTFALSAAARSWRRNVPEPASRRPARPLTVPGVRAVVLVVLVSTAGLAAFEVAVTGIAARTHQPAATGVLFALWLAGSLLGGWLYGRRSWSMRLDVQLAALLAVCGVTALAPLLANDLLAVAPLLVVAGLAIAPATSVQFAIMSAVAPGRSRTEAFTWASTASFLGVAGGSWLCGAAVQSRGPSAGILLAGLLALLAAGVALMNRRALSPVPGLRALHERTGAVVAESYLAPVRGFLEPTDSPHFGTPTQRTPQTAGVAGHPSAVAET